jgi:hypothetical protein
MLAFSSYAKGNFLDWKSLYGLPLYPSLNEAASRGFEQFAGSNLADGAVLRKRATKGWEYP